MADFPSLQITVNTTGMVAALSVTADHEARDHCVVAVKGTFLADEDGSLQLAPRQEAIVRADEHYGDPSNTAVRRECEFVLRKVATDVLIDGYAVSPNRRPATEMLITLEVQGRRKDILVVGERRWVSTIRGLVASEPMPFSRMPLTFDRAFGGQDPTKGADRVAVERHNLVGVGFHMYRGRADIAGTPLPNLEHPLYRISNPQDRPPPVGVGCVGRNWLPRIAFAGTYDDHWRDLAAPFLPADFDLRYFQSAPEDQQFPAFRGEELIRCIHMAERPIVQYRIPSFQVSIVFGFRDRHVHTIGVLDTVILQPHLSTVILLWRASVPLGKKLHQLHRVTVGLMPDANDGICGFRNGKPVFQRMDAALRFVRKVAGGGA